MRGTIAVAILMVVACGPPPREVDGPPGTPPPDAPATIDAPVDATPGVTDHVYVTSYFKLDKGDPVTLELTLVGPYQWPVGMEQEMMTDIAVDKEKNITGISFGAVFSVDKDTAQCTFLSALDTSFNGLSFLPQPDDTEILIGTGLDGSVWEINKMTGASSQIGDFGGVMESSGDRVSVYGCGTVAAMKK